MIHEILFPTRLSAGYYVVEQSYLVITVYDSFVSATLVVGSGAVTTVKQAEHVMLQDHSPVHVQTSIKKLVSMFASYNQLIVVMQSSKIFFKQMTLPFSEYEKIKMVLPYEIEAHLPFKVEEAFIDFSILRYDAGTKTSQVLVAVAQKQFVDEIIDSFEKNKLRISGITLLPCALQTFVQEKQKSYLLVDIGWEHTFVLSMDEQKGILGMRVIAQGVLSFLQQQADHNETDVQSQIDLFIEQKDVQHFSMQSLFKEIQTSLWGFAQSGGQHSLSHVYVTGVGILKQNIKEEMQHLLSVEVELLPYQKILGAHKNIKIKTYNEWCAEAIFAGVYYVRYQAVNLLAYTRAAADDTIVSYQLYTGMFLTIVLFGSMYWIGLREQQSWEDLLAQSRQQVSKEIQKYMNIDTKGEQITKLVDKTNEYLKREKKLWFSFSRQSEQSLLEYLQDLSKIDRESLGLKIKNLKLTHDEVAITGSVQDYESLTTLKYELNDLTLLAVDQEPREPNAFVIKLKSKNTGDTK